MERKVKTPAATKNQNQALWRAAIADYVLSSDHRGTTTLTYAEQLPSVWVAYLVPTVQYIVSGIVMDGGCQVVAVQ